MDASRTITKLALYTLSIVVFIILLSFFFGSESGFNAIKNVFSGVKDSVNVNIGAGEVKGEKPELPDKHKEGIFFLKGIMELMKGKQECFLNYQLTGEGSDEGKNGLPNLEETSIIFQKDKDDTLMIFMGGVSGKQEISREKINDITPCVISGSSAVETFHGGNSVPEGFNDRYLSDTLLPENYNELNYYNSVEKILITNDGENKISYNDGPLLDFEDGGFLFTPDGKNVCFFPTKDGDNSCDGDSNQEGLDDDCLGDAGEDDDNSLPNLIRNNQLEWCTG